MPPYIDAVPQGKSGDDVIGHREEKTLLGRFYRASLLRQQPIFSDRFNSNEPSVVMPLI
jgi:hypothetical protein